MKQKEQEALCGEEKEVVWLAQKYQCPEILSAIELSLYRAVMSRQTPSSVHFEVAVALKAWPLCGQIIYDMDDENGDVSPQVQFLIDPRLCHPTKSKLFTNSARFFYSVSLERFWPLTIPKRGSAIRGWDELLQRSCMKRGEHITSLLRTSRVDELGRTGISSQMIIGSEP